MGRRGKRRSGSQETQAVECFVPGRGPRGRPSCREYCAAAIRRRLRLWRSPRFLGPLRASVITARPGLAVGLLAGTAADALLADPRRFHPVAGFGRSSIALERLTWADSRGRGVAHVVACVGAAVLVGVAAERGAGELRRSAMTAAAVWAVLGGAGLARAAVAVGDPLRRADLDEARAALPALCGRDPSSLDVGEIVRATVESVAENTSDAAVAPLFWGAVAGVPGLLGYRAVNTLDAMIGHRTTRYRRFGWAAARLDDVANLVPARLTAVLAAACAPLVGGSSAATCATVRADGARHPSPNSGRCEAAFAGALGLRLGGTTIYRDGATHRVEQRGPLGSGSHPVVADIDRAARLSRLVTATAAIACAATVFALPRLLSPRWIRARSVPR